MCATKKRRLETLKPRLSSSPPLVAGGDCCELDNRRLPLSAAARALWCEFYDAVERQQAEGAPLARARAWAAKAAEHAARIAGVVTIIGDRRAHEIDEVTMAGGIEAADFYLGEHVRLMGQSQERQHANRLHVLLEWMRDRGSLVLHADVLQRSPRPVRELKAEGISRLLDELASLGQVRRTGDRWELRP